MGWEVGSRKRDEEREGTKMCLRVGIAGMGIFHERGRRCRWEVVGGGGGVGLKNNGGLLDAILWD